MAVLSKDALKDSLRVIIDKEYPEFSGFPTSSAAVGLAWGNALNQYFKDAAIPPGITDARLNAAKAAFAAIFQPSATLQNALLLFPTAMTAYATALIALPAPIPGALIPPAPLVLVLPAPTNTAEVAANAIATLVDTWARTGTYTVPPAGPVPWS